MCIQMESKSVYMDDNDIITKVNLCLSVVITASMAGSCWVLLEQMLEKYTFFFSLLACLYRFLSVENVICQLMIVFGLFIDLIFFYDAVCFLCKYESVLI